jgi:hypothetical protein
MPRWSFMAGMRASTDFRRRLVRQG